MKRLGPHDWFQAARDILKESGHGQLTIRAMGERLGVSTGSFYHHFANRDDFVHQFFEDWSERNRANIGDLGSFDQSRLDAINRRVNKLLDHRLEAAVRAWALFDPAAAEEVRRFDAARRKVFIRYYEEIVDRAKARNLADLHLCALAGAQFMYLDTPSRLRGIGNFVNEAAAETARGSVHRGD